MKQIEVRFEAAPELERIEVLIRAPEADGQVAAIQRQLSGLAPETLTVFDADELQRMIPLEDIISASVNGKLVNIVTGDGSWYTRRTLQSLEDELDSRSFMRVSRYEIVNLDKVLRYDFTLAGTLRLELAGGIETWASRRCIPLIRKRLLGRGNAR